MLILTALLKKKFFLKKKVSRTTFPKCTFFGIYFTVSFTRILLYSISITDQYHAICCCDNLNTWINCILDRFQFFKQFSNKNQQEKLICDYYFLTCKTSEKIRHHQSTFRVGTMLYRIYLFYMTLSSENTRYFGRIIQHRVFYKKRCWSVHLYRQRERETSSKTFKQQQKTVTERLLV